MSDDYQVQNMYSYSRKSYKRREPQDNDLITPREDVNIGVDITPRMETFMRDAGPSCDCEVETGGDLANILHKKCPVINLAQQQLQRLLDAEAYMGCNTRTYRSIYDILRICKDVLLQRNKCQCILLCLIGISFFTGIILGAASCGAHLGRFDSPILRCIDKLFAFETNSALQQETYRAIF